MMYAVNDREMHAAQCAAERKKLRAALRLPADLSGLFGREEERAELCLKPQEITDYLGGVCSELECEGIEMHLEGCGLCRERLATAA